MNCGSLNPQIPQWVDGTIEGTIEIQGQKDRLQTVNADLQLVGEGKVKAAFFEPLIKSFPSHVSQRQDLEKILEQKGMVPIELAHVKIEEWHDKKVSAIVHLKSKKMNIDLKQPITIHFDEDLHVIIKQWQKFSWVLNYIHTTVMDSLSTAVRRYYGDPSY